MVFQSTSDIQFRGLRRRRWGRAQILSDGSNLATKSHNDGNVYSVESPSLNTVLTIEAAQPTLATTTNTSRQHKQHFFMVSLSQTYGVQPESYAWADIATIMQDDIFLVQIDGPVIMSYKINATQIPTLPLKMILLYRVRSPR